MNIFPGLERITFNPSVMGGRACIRGLRISVALVLNLVANGMTVPEIIAEYPDLEPVDIEAGKLVSRCHYGGGQCRELRQACLH